jgi:hypothetical protein
MKHGPPRQRGRRSINIAQAGNIVDYTLRTGNENQHLQPGARDISIMPTEKENDHDR